MTPPTDIAAAPDPRGGALVLRWTNPVLAGFRGTQILRREGQFPAVPSDTQTSTNVVFDDTSTGPGATGRFVDTGLKPETVYYYAIVAYDVAHRPYPAFVSAVTTAPYATAAYLYRNIPQVYRAYDADAASAAPSAALAPADAGKGPLLRLIEMLGPEFDLLRSAARGARSFSDPRRVDGTLLPLLAQWIGWQTNYAAPIPLQRNEVRFAPQYYATTGLAANLRASVNRLVNWDARIKEFAHNVFLSNRPEELTIREQQRQGGQWLPASGVSLDVAYEGRPSALLAADGRPWLFHHVRQGAAGVAPDRWHVWCKISDRGDWLPAFRLTSDASVNKYPAAVQRADGSVLLFWSSTDVGAPGRPVPRLRMQQLAVGRPALNARAQASTAGPFAFEDGDVLGVTIGTLTATITLRAEQFADIAHATAAETAALVDRELPDVDVTATADGKIRFAARASGAASLLAFPNSTAGAKLGVPAAASPGADAIAARITGARVEPFALADGDTLVITVDADVPRTVTFTAAQTSAAQVAQAINQAVLGVAQAAGGAVQLTSPRPGASSLIAIDINLSSAAGKLGFAVAPPVPVPPVDETEPSAMRDTAGSVWLFWSSLRSGQWNIWYSRFDGTSWGVPKALTAGARPDREPFVLFDPAGAGRIWVFWSRKKTNGLWNVFYRTTTKLDFNTLANADWTEAEMSPVSTSYDNREPAGVVSGAGSVDLYFVSNRTDGWKIWQKPVTTANQGLDAQVTTGQFTHRAPVPLDLGNGILRLFFRGNESVTYASTLYPLATTVDARYAGSTTADTRNVARLSQRGTFHDIGHYCHDTPRPSADQEAKRVYARDTVGIFLAPDTSDQQLIVRSRTLIADTLTRFLPIQLRAVLIADLSVIEYVYSYDQRDAPAPQVIADSWKDTIS